MAKIKAKTEGQTVRGTPEKDTIIGLGGNEKLLGKAGNDKIKGRDGNDKLDGGDDNDKLFGEDGNDKLKGGNGNDLLDGGAGKNTLTGGDGRDQFVISEIDAAEKIKDYVRGEDQLDLSSLLPNFGASGDVLDDFIQVDDERTGETRISVDADGRGSNADFVLVARLLGVESFDNPTPADFGLREPGTPVANEPMPAREAFEGTPFNFTVPPNAFSDPDGQPQPLSYKFELATGGSLPNWITSIRADGFTGTPRGTDKDTHEILVTASDGKATANGTFTLVVDVEQRGDDADDSSEDGAVSDFSRDSQNPAISFSGRFVAFDTTEDDLIQSVRSQSVFVRDAVSEDRILVSPELVVTDDGRLLNAAANPTISETGRFIAYETFVDDGNPNDEISVDPDATKQIDIVDLTQPDVFTPVVRGNAPSSNPDISDDGTKVAFQSDASNLSGSDGNGSDIFLKDFLDDSITLVSAGRSGDSTNPAISQDGSHVAFENRGDIFVNEIESGDIVRFAAPDGLDARSPDISEDGNRLVFETVADGEGAQAVYVVVDASDPDSKPQLVAKWDAEDTPGEGFSASPSISADGRLVSYVAPNEVEIKVDGDIDKVAVLELRVQELSSKGDLQGLDVIVQSSDLDDSAIQQGVLSGDGKFAAFASSEQSFGDGLENNDGGGIAVFSSPTDGFLQGQPLESAALAIAEVVGSESEDVDALLQPASVEEGSAAQTEANMASFTIDGGSMMNLDQVLAAPQDDVV